MKGTVFTGIAIIFLLFSMAYFFIVIDEKVLPTFENASNVTQENFKATGVNESTITLMQQDQEDFTNALKTVPFVMLFGGIIAILVIAMINKANTADGENQ